MTRKIQIKRGNAANLPALSSGELGLTLDTKKIYVGHEQGNVPLAMEGELCNPNLLHNSDFRNPINQRGLTKYTPSYTYTIDRWSGYDCTVSVGNGYIDITGSSVYSKFFQWFGNKDIISNGVTLSFNVGGDIYSLAGSTPKTKNFSDFDLDFGINGEFSFFQISNFYGKTLRLYGAKLELGEISTLRNDPPQDHVKELRNCLWYDEDKVRPPYCNPNLLDNGDFRNKDAIVNQRGIENGWSSPTSMYFIDRWRSHINIAHNTTYTFETNGLGVQVSEGYGGIAQMLEFAPTEGVYTFSAIIDGTLHMLTFDASKWIKVEGTDIEMCVTTYLDRKIVRILFQDTVKHIIQRVKLELGTVSTILSDSPQNYGVELAKCQRYQLLVTPWSRYRATHTDANNIDFTIPIPGTVRVTPTISNIAKVVVRSTIGSIQTGFTYTYPASPKNCIHIRATKVSHDLTDAQLYIDGVGILFDANL